MDRLNQLRAGAEEGAGRGADATLDTSSPPSEAYMSANESSSKYFSLSDSTFDITPIKDVSLASAASSHEPDHTMTDDLMSNLSPISKKDPMLDSYKIGKQIEAANILSGGVDIFDDNDNSFDGDELVIDDNVDMDVKSNLDKELQIDETVSEATLVESPVDVASKDTEVVLQIDGKNVDAIDIGNGLYLYRKAGQEELAAVQIITENNQQAPSFKFLKVRENAEGNLEVYEEFEVEVSKDAPVNVAKPLAKATPHVPIKDINKVGRESSSKISEKKDNAPPKEASSNTADVITVVKETESKTELNLNGKMMKINESRKSPVVGSFTPMTYHSTPNKEGKPLTKTMVDQQLHPSRHSDNVKKTIEVHTDSQKKLAFEDIKSKPESPVKKILTDNIVTKEISTENDILKSMELSEKEDLKKNNADISTGSNVDTIATGDQNKSKEDDKTKLDTVEPPKVPIDKPHKIETPERAELKKSENDMVLPKPKDTNVPAKSIPVSESNDITDNPLLRATEVSEILTPNTENLVRPISILDTENVSAKDADKKSSKMDVQKVTVETAVATSEEVNKNEQKENTLEITAEVATSAIELPSTKQSIEETKQSVTAPAKNSEILNEISSSSLKETQKTVQPIEILNDSIEMDKTTKSQAERSKTPVPDRISTPESTAKLLEDTKEKDVNVAEQHKKTESPPILEAKKINEVDVQPSNINSTQHENKPMEILQTEKSDQIEKILEPQAASKPDILHPVSDGSELTRVSKIEKVNPVVKSIEPKTLQTDVKLNQVTKSIVIPTQNVDTPTVSTAGKPNVLEKKIDTKAVSQTNKFISVPKGVKLKIVSKTGIEKKIEPNLLPQIDGKISTAKQNEPNTCTKIEKLNPTSKRIEPRVVSKIDHVHPGIKGVELKTISKTVLLNPVPKGIDPMISKDDKPGPVANQLLKKKAVIITSNKIIVPSNVECLTNKEINIPQVTSNLDAKALNNNHSAVPFGKWTDANRQEFLNKFKEIKVPATSNTKQIKNSNDLNRIDVLKKIDSQRSNNASAKTQDKSNVKDTVFSSKIAPLKVETKIPMKVEVIKVKPKPVDTKNESKQDSTEPVSSTGTTNVGTSDDALPEAEERREVNVNDLIGKAIVDMLNRPVPMPMTRSPLDEPRPVDRDLTQTEAIIESQTLNIDQEKPKIDQRKLTNDQQKLKSDQAKQSTDQQTLKTDQRKLNNDQLKLNIEQKIDEDSSGSLDDIEMKMNELHGIPFVERPPHELPKVYKTYSKSSKDINQSKGGKKLPTSTSKQTLVEENVIELESDDEVIGHEPITGDIELDKKKESKLPASVKSNVSEKSTAPKDSQKKTVITENDFDKFARRNSITYENCLTVKFDGKEPANVVRSIKEKESTKNNPKNDIRKDSKMPQKQTTSQVNAIKIPNTKFGAVPEDPNNKNYQSKIHNAYQSALTAKRQLDRPISIIEDKPVKVVFMDSNSEFVPNQLNVQGKELSPVKKPTVESTQASRQLVNTDSLETNEDKQQDDAKTKTKHQRKQVLNPVESPELEVIQSDVSPKKKRKTEDNKMEKGLKNLVHKKSYLLGRTVPDDKIAPHDVVMPIKETINRAEIVAERSAVSAIDSLVKAAELLENQSVQSISPNSDSQENTPVKRGRGRPRKYPVPEGARDSKIVSPSPQKKPRLIDAKPIKHDPVSSEERSDEDEMIRENWTMGKINENIVCPICNKLFRSENVVFKHVKHCTGVSPTRSDLEKCSPRRRIYSRESDNKSFESQSEEDFDVKPKSVKKSPKKLKPKESSRKSEEIDIIVIEDTPVKEKSTEREPRKNKTIEERSKTIKEVEYKFTETRGNPDNQAEANPVKEKTLKEIADEQLKAKQLEKLAEEKLDEPITIKETIEEKAKKLQQSSNLVCEFCGKTFRQLSYLSNHKLQHKKEQLKKLEAKLTAKLQVFSCEVCKKEFRKLHHLVQHRVIHNPEVPTRTTRKSSSEQSDAKAKEQPASKPSEDTSAGFRCEPCDKSFRKLHHLVEHRETHDGINRQKTNAQTAAQPTMERPPPPPPPQCDVCKKSFRKLHHLIEHKEQHHVEQVETSSEKSDDKSVQSSLSTRDIIHECSLCYMVFPNEHSLNKHFVICQQKKKRQSKAKDKPENADGTDIVEESTEDSIDAEGVPKIVAVEVVDNDIVEKDSNNITIPEKVEKKRVSEKPDIEKTSETENSVIVGEIAVPNEKDVTEVKSAPSKRDLPKSDDSTDAKNVIPEKIKKIDDQQVKVKLPRKTPTKNKIAPTVTKRQKSLAPIPVLPEGDPTKTNDDDEVRYMINPHFKVDETNEGKVFMQVRSNKRNSLQIERPNSKDLVSRRTSLQHPPKIPRLKAKAVEPKVVPTKIYKTKLDAASTDSDDSDVKYAFPKAVKEQTSKVEGLKGKQASKNAPRKSLAVKRKSLVGIAKRKSLGQGIAKHKAIASPARTIKRRTLGVEHRCDCGQLFNSVALLTRHTSLAHTPPRIRRRRSPPPETKTKSSRKSTVANEPAKTTRKSSVRSEASNSNAKPTRKSSAKSDTPETRKSVKPESQENKSSAKPRRSTAHRGVPVPEKMRKLMMKNAK